MIDTELDEVNDIVRRSFSDKVKSVWRWYESMGTTGISLEVSDVSALDLLRCTLHDAVPGVYLFFLVRRGDELVDANDDD